MTPAQLTLEVTAVRAEAHDVMSFELRDPAGRPLPRFTPGAHLEVMLPAVAAGEQGLIRHYSLCNSAAESDRYLIAVGRAENGRGGSRTLHERVRVGSRLQVSSPRNNFPLHEAAGHSRFIAGGIGITPVLSMIRWCMDQGRSWSLLYCVRSRVRAPFLAELQAFGPAVRFHFDDEAQGRVADLAAELAEGEADEHVYCCGPGPLMAAVEAATALRPRAAVHFERFSAGDALRPPAASTGSFDVLLRSSGRRLKVPPEKSILEILEDHGIAVPYSCREGLCRTCETLLCSGEAEHRDYVLSEEERAAQKSLMVCVSRSRTAVLELDL